MNFDCLGLVFGPAVMFGIKIDALKRSLIVVGMLRVCVCVWGNLVALDYQDQPFLFLFSHSPFSVCSQVSAASLLLLQAVPGENQFALILVILERSSSEWRT